MRILTAIVSITVLLSVACKPEKPATVRVLKPEYITPDSLGQIHAIDDSLVKPILYATIPSLDGLPVDEAKSKFISAVLPAILVAKYRISQDLKRVKKLDSLQSWTHGDSVFFNIQKERYGTDNFPLLVSRMHTHPTSIVLAQAIVESGWGSSSLFQKANNLFGIWSYHAGEPRVSAGKTRNGVHIYLRKYDDLSESIVDYFGTVARTRAYRKFRAARLETDNVNQLLPYLKYYSERRDDYVNQLRTIIRQNRLTRFDDYQIDPAYFVEEEVPS